MNNQLLTIFKKIINNIIKLLPEGEEQLIILEYYDSILKLDNLDNYKNNDILNKFVERINNNSTNISNLDDTIFNDNLLDKVKLHDIWLNKMDLNDKNELWKNLQTICMIIINISSSNELKELLSGKTKIINKENKKDVKDLKKLKKIKNNIEKIKKEQNTSSKNKDEKLDEVFENTGIGKLAKSIAENMNFDKLMGDIDPNEKDMSKIMQNFMNPSTFMGVFNDINKQVQTEINEGNISENTLKNEANQLFGNFENNPIFSSMLNNPMMKQAMNQDNNNTSRNKTHERLKKKVNK